MLRTGGPYANFMCIRRAPLYMFLTVLFGGRVQTVSPAPPCSTKYSVPSAVLKLEKVRVWPDEGTAGAIGGAAAGGTFDAGLVTILLS